MTLLLVFTLVVTACPAERPPEPQIQNTGIQTPPPPMDGDEGDMMIVGSSAPAPDPDELKYKVELTANKKMKVGEEQFCRVWIGGENQLPQPMEELVRDTTTVTAYSNSYAVVTLIAPKCKIDPDTPQTLPLKAAGSSVVYTLTPLKRGNSYVTATVNIYDSEGNEYPQSIKRLSVKISSNFWSNFWDRQGDHATEMEEVFWKKFIPFFSALLVLLLGAALFVVRKYIKKKTGYDEKENKENL